MAEHAHDPHIICPKCSHQIPLTESLAAPLLEAERRDLQKKLADREADFARKGVETFDLIDGVYVAHPQCAVPVALTLRQGLLEVASARTTQAGQQSKAEQVYQYLTGVRFKQRIEAIVERFKDMREGIDKERKFMTKAWAKRKAQLGSMIDSTVGMVGDLLWHHGSSDARNLRNRRASHAGR
jgi:Uncharacterized protein conserved in bacteria (DUF2130)